MENFEQSQKQRKISLLAEVPAIRESRNEMVTKRERLKDLIEQPLLSACEEMYGTNRGQSPFLRLLKPS